MTSANGRVPIRLLFFISDTGGGHRSAASAVGQALDRAYPGRFAPVICDPLLGPGAPLRLRWLVGLYGPAIRLTGDHFDGERGAECLSLWLCQSLRRTTGQQSGGVDRRRPCELFHNGPVLDPG